MSDEAYGSNLFPWVRNQHSLFTYSNEVKCHTRKAFSCNLKTKKIQRGTREKFGVIEISGIWIVVAIRGLQLLPVCKSSLT